MHAASAFLHLLMVTHHEVARHLGSVTSDWKNKLNVFSRYSKRSSTSIVAKRESKGVSGHNRIEYQ